MTDDERSTLNGEESDATEPPWAGQRAGQRFPNMTQPSTTPEAHAAPSWFASKGSPEAGGGAGSLHSAGQAGQASASPLQQATFDMLQDMQNRLQRMEADVRAAASTSMSAGASPAPSPAQALAATDQAAPQADGATVGPYQQGAVATPLAAVNPHNSAGTAAAPHAQPTQPATTADVPLPPWASGLGMTKGRQHTLVGWGPAPVPYVTSTTTGETVTSAWLRDRTTSAWSTGRQPVILPVQAATVRHARSMPGRLVKGWQPPQCHASCLLLLQAPQTTWAERATAACTAAPACRAWQRHPCLAPAGGRGQWWMTCHASSPRSWQSMQGKPCANPGCTASH